MLFKLCCFLILLSLFFPILWINLQSIKSSQALPRFLPNITRLTGRTWLGSLTVQLALWSCLLLLSCTHNILSLRKRASGHLSPPRGKGTACTRDLFQGLLDTCLLYFWGCSYSTPMHYLLSSLYFSKWGRLILIMAFPGSSRILEIITKKIRTIGIWCC